jgi:hypothetical protein
MGEHHRIHQLIVVYSDIINVFRFHRLAATFHDSLSCSRKFVADAS